MKNRWHSNGAVDLGGLGVSLRRLDQVLNAHVAYTDQDVVPISDAEHSLGNSSKKWLDLHLAGTLVTSALSATGNVGIGGTLTVSGAATLKGALSVGGATVLSSNLTVGGTLTVSGTTTLKGNVSVSATTVVMGNPSTATIAFIDAPAGAVSRLTFRTGALDRWRFERGSGAESGSDAGSTLNLLACTDAGAAIDNVFVITRAAGGTVNFRRPLTLDSTLTVSAAATFKGNLSVASAITAGDSVSLGDSGDFHKIRNAAANNNSVVAITHNVLSAFTSSVVEVGIGQVAGSGFHLQRWFVGDGATTAYASAVATIRGDGRALFVGGLSAGASVSLGDTLTVSGAATLQGTLTVSGATTLKSTLSVEGNIKVTGGGRTLELETTTDAFHVIAGDANRSAAGTTLMALRGDWNGNDVAQVSFLAGGDTVNKDDGQIGFYTQPDAATGLVGRWLVKQDGDLHTVADDTYDIGASGTARPRDLFLGGAVTLSAGATVGGTLTVSGTATLKGAVSAEGAVTLASTLTVSAATTLKGALSVEGAATLASTLTVSSTAAILGAVTLGSTLTVSGNATLGGTLSVAGNVAVGGQILADNGSAGSPAIVYSGATDTGILFGDVFGLGAGVDMAFATGGTVRWGVEKNGHMRFGDNLYDIGASGGQRPRSLFLAANAQIGGVLSVSATATFKDTISVAGNAVVGTTRSTDATTGFLYLPSCAGTPTGTPVSATGAIPVIVDSTNNKLYFYSGGAWRDAGP